MTEEERRAELERILRASPTVMTVLRGVRDAWPPDWRLFSGAVYQTVWNALTDRDPDHGIRDFDIGYFDGSDLSWDAEDVVIRRVAEQFEPPLRERVEVRNQARVHLWFRQKFGEDYSPVASTDQALIRFVCPAFAVGVRLEPDDSMSIAAPFGLAELFAIKLSPNPTRRIARDWDRVVERLTARWPELTVTTRPSGRSFSV